VNRALGTRSAGPVLRNARRPAGRESRVALHALLLLCPALAATALLLLCLQLPGQARPQVDPQTPAQSAGHVPTEPAKAPPQLHPRQKAVWRVAAQE